MLLLPFPTFSSSGPAPIPLPMACIDVFFGQRLWHSSRSRGSRVQFLKLLSKSPSSVIQNVERINIQSERRFGRSDLKLREGEDEHRYAVHNQTSRSRTRKQICAIGLLDVAARPATGDVRDLSASSR